MAALSAPDPTPDAAPAAAPAAPAAAPAASIKHPDLGVYGRTHAVAAVAAVAGVDPKDVFFLWKKNFPKFLEEDIIPAYVEANQVVAYILRAFKYAGQKTACWGFGPGSSSTPSFPDDSDVGKKFFELVYAVHVQVYEIWESYTDWKITGYYNQSIFDMIVEQLTSHFWPDWREYDADNA